MGICRHDPRVAARRQCGPPLPAGTELNEAGNLTLVWVLHFGVWYGVLGSYWIIASHGRGAIQCRDPTHCHSMQAHTHVRTQTSDRRVYSDHRTSACDGVRNGAARFWRAASHLCALVSLARTRRLRAGAQRCKMRREATNTSRAFAARGSELPHPSAPLVWLVPLIPHPTLWPFLPRAPLVRRCG